MKKIIFLLVIGIIFTGLSVAQTENLEKERKAMVEGQIIARGINDPRVIEAMLKVPREAFIPEVLRNAAYGDSPLPIGYNQTISQPYVVAFMTEALGLKKSDKVLEIGTGSGYQAAVLAEIAGEIYTIEIIPPLAEEARGRLNRLGYENITVIIGDGYLGFEEEAPFDAIMVTASPAGIPEHLVEQLKIGGRMIVPAGRPSQELYLITKTEDGVEKKPLLPVRFVPMVHGR